VLIFLLLVNPLKPLSAHDFYLSVTSIQYHPETQRLSVKVKLFINDLETSILQEQGVRLRMGTDTPHEFAPIYVEQYLCSKLFISINGSPISLSYLNQQVEPAEVFEDNVIICQLEAHDIPPITTIKVYNSLLTDAFDSQTNIINIRANNTVKVINLDRKLPEDEVCYR